MAYCIVMVLIFLIVLLIVDTSLLKMFSSRFIDGICAAALVLAKMTIKESIFMPLATISATNGLYMLVLIVSNSYVSLQCV